MPWRLVLLWMNCRHNKSPAKARCSRQQQSSAKERRTSHQYRDFGSPTQSKWSVRMWWNPLRHRCDHRSPAHLTQFDINLVLLLRFLSVEGGKGFEYYFLALRCKHFDKNTCWIEQWGQGTRRKITRIDLIGNGCFSTLCHCSCNCCYLAVGRLGLLLSQGQTRNITQNKTPREKKGKKNIKKRQRRKGFCIFTCP